MPWYSTAGSPSPAADSSPAAITQHAELLVASDDSCRLKHHSAVRTGRVRSRLPEGHELLLLEVFPFLSSGQMKTTVISLYILE